jgi:hypothetical protein
MIGQCKLARERGRLSRGRQVVLDVLLEHGAVSSVSLARALGEIGTSVGESTIRAHRRGDCACQRVTL